MDILLWLVQVFLAAIFILFGFDLVLAPREKLQQKTPWIADFPREGLKVIGIAFALAAIGIIFPLLIGDAHILVIISASILSLMSAALVVAFYQHGNRKHANLPVILTALSLFVAIGRLFVETN